MVHEYHLQPFGPKKTWFAAQPVTKWTFRRWRKMLFEGDLDRNLIPREHGGRSLTSPKLNSAWAGSLSLRARIQRSRGTSKVGTCASWL